MDLMNTARLKAALVLNGSRRFRYTLDFKKEEEKQQTLRKIRAHAQVIRGFLWEACQDYTLIILVVGAVISLALGIHTEGIKRGWYDGAGIAFAVIIVIVVTAVSDYRQSLRFQNIIAEKRNIHLQVIRGGRRVEVSIFDVVVGDVVPLNIGDQVHKNSREPFLLSGCKVADGCGTMLVTSVGINTEWGLLMGSISEDTGEETPMQVRLNGIATFIGIVGVAGAFGVLVVLLIRFFTGHTKNPDGTVQFRPGKTSADDAANGAIEIMSNSVGIVADAVDVVIKILSIMVTIVVVAVPEGLPLAVTLILAYSMRKMMADKALVRRLSACETMGSATTICSDKTGTLTLNQMTVVSTFIGGQKIDPPVSKSELPLMLSTLLIEGIAQNTNGSVFVPEPDSQVHIHWKGAAEIILALCTGYIDANDHIVPMDEDKRIPSSDTGLSLQKSFFKQAIDDMAAGSLRCVAIAYRSYEIEKVPVDEEQLSQWALPEDDLILLAIIGLKVSNGAMVLKHYKSTVIQGRNSISLSLVQFWATFRTTLILDETDPCRPGVKEVVRLCQNAGVKVRMVTGDNLQTAKAIALECGILSSDENAMEPYLIEGRVFRRYSEEERNSIAEDILVMGRSSPNDKLLLVQALKKRKHVVAVTGDGTNDASALHEADVGLSMGIQGTEVAKESSDIVILDDNFASVVKKFIQFQLSVNVATIIINIVAAIFSGEVPLNTVQLLWVNLIMDTLGALALATEPPTDHLMHKPPVGRRAPLITNIMWRNLLIQTIYQASVVLVLAFRGRSLLGLQHQSAERANKVNHTIMFNAFVLCQAAYSFSKASAPTNARLRADLCFPLRKIVAFHPKPSGDFGIGRDELCTMMRDHDFYTLERIGGRFLWEACQDYTLIILVVAAVISLALGIRKEGIKRGWYDGAGITFAVIIIIVVTVAPSSVY
ncbi:hypothetical protein GH714_020736 [Hevea brasiliensis]|uniref:Cation-transporting P-type ATPase C-terminal domain-containing protein n=1 Tax=Hevea brasiliensis TaxID=3981 RepID=A0A6A6M416_HEVBR|nr:hypothetical protein GH714_020736 [Hevea brasiliensis]